MQKLGGAIVLITFILLVYKAHKVSKLPIE